MPRLAPARPAWHRDAIPETVTSSAMLYTARHRTRRAKPTEQPWQSLAWEMYDTVPELRAGVNWIANVCSLAVLRVGKRKGGEILTDKDHVSAKATDALHALADGQEGQEELIRQATIHLTVAGECWYVQRGKSDKDPASAPDSITQIVATNEIVAAGDGWAIQGEGGEVIPLSDDDTAIRIWRPHPHKHLQADSPVKAALPALQEVRRMDAHIQSQQTSRIMAGRVLKVPSEIQVRKEPNDNRSDAEVLTERLGQMMSGAIDDPGNPDNLVPMVFSAPAETLDSIGLIDFWGSLDEKAQEGRDRAIQRVAVGLDMPTEILTGMSDMNRWGTWQIEESSVKIHAYPLLRLLCGILTVAWLHPYTQDTSDVLYPDTSTMRIRPNRSKEAIELFQLLQLSPEALVRETGFSVDDLPKDDELKKMILLKMTTASWSPDQAQAAAKELGVDLGFSEGDNIPREARPLPNLDGIEGPVDPPSMLPGAQPPEPPGFAAAVATALACQRAMERAGNRLRTLTNKRPDTDAWNTHTEIPAFPDKIDDLLTGYATYIPAPFVNAKSFSFVHSYCSELLRTRTPFDLETCIREALK